jgi:hypothetical protein
MRDANRLTREWRSDMRTIYGFIYTLRPYERGIRETLGKYSGFVMPGLGLQIPFVHITRVRDVREHTMDIEPQPVITKDNVEITVDGVMWVRPTIDEEGISTFIILTLNEHHSAGTTKAGLRIVIDESLARRNRQQSAEDPEYLCRRMGADRQQSGNPPD